MKRQLAILLLLTLSAWFSPTSVLAEEKTETIFQIDESLKEPKTLYKPYEFPKPIQAKTNVHRTMVSKTTPTSQTKFAAGYCTDYVARQVKVTWSGNANQWITNAKAQGYQVDRNPTAGAIIVTNESRMGHVAFIESVDGSLVTFSEWNYAGRFVKTIRTLDISNSIIKGIIHP